MATKVRSRRRLWWWIEENCVIHVCLCVAVGEEDRETLMASVWRVAKSALPEKRFVVEMCELYREGSVWSGDNGHSPGRPSVAR